MVRQVIGLKNLLLLIWYMGAILNQLLMTCCCTHKWVHFSTLIGEAFSCSRWWFSKRSITGQDIKKNLKICEIVIPKYDIFNRPRESLKRRSHRNYKTQKWVKIWKWHILDTEGQLDIWIQRGCASMHNSCASPSQTKIRIWREEIDINTCP